MSRVWSSRRFLTSSLAALALFGATAAGNGWSAEKTEPVKAASHEQARQRWALLIGVDKYSELKSLKYCGRDAESLSKQLILAGFAPNNVFLVTGSAKDPKYLPFKANIERQLDLVIHLVEADDLLVISFSGHGIHEGKTSYLCPSEARVEDPAGTMVSMDLVYKRLSDCKARWKLLLVDACRNDVHREGTRAADSSARSTRDFARSLEKPPQGILALTSCAVGEVSLESPEFGHGVFMHYLLEGLAGKADREGGDSNGKVSLLELYRFANVNTKLFAARSDNLVQSPTLKGEIPEDYEITAVSSNPQVLEAVAKGDEHLAANRYDDAIAAYTDALRLDPRYTTALVRRADVHFEKRDYNAAIMDLTVAIYAEPKAYYYARRSMAYLNLKDKERAEVDAKEAVRLDPECAAAHSSMGSVARFNGDTNRALAEYSEAIRLDPKYYRALANRASFYVAQREYDKALADYDAALKINPKYSHVYFQRGHLYAGQKDHARAVADYTEALRHDPKNELVLNDRAAARLAMGQHAEAIADCTEAIRLKADYALPHYNRARAYAAKNQVDLALADYSECIRIDPKYASAYFGRGYLHNEKKQYAKSIADYTEYLHLNPKDEIAYNNRGNSYFMLTDYANSIADYTESIRLKPTYDLPYHNRGRVHVLQKQYDEGIRDFTEALRINPKFQQSYFQRGYAYLEKKDYAASVADNTEAIRLNANDAVAHNNRGFAYFNLQQFDNSVIDYHEAIRLDPKMALAYINRGDAYRMHYQDYDNAIADYSTAIRLGTTTNPGLYRARAWCYQQRGMENEAARDEATAVQIEQTQKK